MDLRYTVESRGLTVIVALTNHARHEVRCAAAIEVGADFVDIQEALQPAEATARASVHASIDEHTLRLRHDHERLAYEAQLAAEGDAAWAWQSTTLRAQLRLASQQQTRLTLSLTAKAAGSSAIESDASNRERESHAERWQQTFTRVFVPGNRIAEDIIARNVRDLASFALLEGPRDEWLTLQAGMPLYPALFGRDTLTAGWQAAFLDGGASLDASLSTLGRLQSNRADDWHDEEPGRIPYQVRRGPLAILDVNPYSAYYADFASPLMYVIALAHLYAWTGDKQSLQRHWDTTRRILDWARTNGDKDNDGYLEYQTRSSKGTKNQGWKDSGDAIVYDDGSPVPSPIATCEIQGYWFAAQQLMSVMCAAMGSVVDAVRTGDLRRN